MPRINVDSVVENCEPSAVLHSAPYAIKIG